MCTADNRFRNSRAMDAGNNEHVFEHRVFSGVAVNNIGKIEETHKSIRFLNDDCVVQSSSTDENLHSLGLGKSSPYRSCQ